MVKSKSVFFFFLGGGGRVRLKIDVACCLYLGHAIMWTQIIMLPDEQLDKGQYVCLQIENRTIHEHTG